MNAERDRELRGKEAVEFACAHLRVVRTDASGWTVEYIDDASGETWVMDYPDSALHGGGSPRLRKK